MLRKLSKVAVLFLMLVCTMGASTIAYDANNPVANPGGKGSQIDAQGTYVLGGKDTYMEITHSATHTTTKQMNIIVATPDKGKSTWKATLSCTPGNYDCIGQFTYFDDTLKAVRFADTGKVNVNVK